MLVLAGCAAVGSEARVVEKLVCRAQNPSGTERVDCAAPPRTYPGDRCNCANNEGKLLYGRVVDAARGGDATP